MKFSSKKSQAAFEAATAAGNHDLPAPVAVTPVDATPEATKEQPAGDSSDGTADPVVAASEEPRFKKPVTVTLPKGSYVRGKYTYSTTEIAGKQRWFANKDVEILEKDGLVILTGEHKYFDKRGMVEATPVADQEAAA